MPIARFQMPDGRIARFEVPDGTTPEQAQSMMQAHFASQNTASATPVKFGKESFKEALQQELADHPIAAKLAAAGTALSDLWYGGKQMFGINDRPAIEANKIIKEANPGSALLGNIGLFAAGGVAAPALNTLKGATIAGAATGALSPTDNPNVLQGKAQNAAMGAAFGYGGTKLGQAVGTAVNSGRQAIANKAAQSATQDAAFQSAREAGYTIPPAVSNPNWLNRTLTSMAGKSATQQAASAKNAEVTQDLARKALGLPENASLSPQVLNQLRSEAGNAYKNVAALDPETANMIEALKDARFNKNVYYKHFERTGDPKSLATAKDFGSKSDALEGMIEDAATNAGKPELVTAMRDARRQIAKTYTVDNAMNDATGTVDARKLARALANGEPLSGELKQIADFAATAPTVAKTPEAMGGDGISKLKFALSTMLGTGGAAASGPFGATAAALPFIVPDAAKSLILSKAYQSAMGSPSYSLPLTSKLAEALLASRNSPMALTGATVPTFAQ